MAIAVAHQGVVGRPCAAIPHGRESDVREMLQILDGIPAEAAGWAAVIAGLAIFAALLAIRDRRRRVQEAARQAQIPPRSQPIRDWHKARAARDVARAAEVAAMQARAVLQIDAVEHAYNRMLAQCAGVMGRLAVRPLEPVRDPAAGAEVVARRPLAA